MMILRTPDELFNNLPEFPFEPHYVEVDGLRIHYIDEGEGDAILCLHGEPSYPICTGRDPHFIQGSWALAMDFVGFGRSDKFADRDHYSFRMHHDTLVRLLRN
jgi:haloalkane dehalogenase